MSGLHTRVDALAGRRLERLVVGHHRRRLERLGQAGALAPSAGGWASHGRRVVGNALDVLVDGADALPQIAWAIEAGPIVGLARRLVLHPEFRLDREDRDAAGAARRSGAARRRPCARVGRCAPAALPPASAQVDASCAALADGTRRACALDARERPMHCHHEKLVVVDGEIAFVGGIDLTYEPAAASTGVSILRAASAGTTRPHGSRTCGGRRRRALPAALGRGRRVRAPPSAVPAAGRRARGAGRPHGAGAIYAGRPAASSGSSSRTCERSARRGDSSTSRTSSSGRRRSSPCSGEAAPAARRRLPPARCCCRRSRTTAPTTRAASSGGSSPRTPATAACSPARCTSAGRTARTRCTSTRRSAIVDDGWLTLGSANLNEHSLFNDTEMNVSRGTRRSRARRGYGSGPSTSSARRRARRRSADVSRRALAAARGGAAARRRARVPPRTVSCGSRTSRAGQPRFAARSTGCSSTARRSSRAAGAEITRTLHSLNDETRLAGKSQT